MRLQRWKATADFFGMRFAEFLSTVRRASPGTPLLILLVIAVAIESCFVLMPGRPVLIHVGTLCDYAVEVDGVLRCGKAAPHRIGDLCPDHRFTGSTVGFRSGDALTSSSLCQQRRPVPGGSGWSRMLPTDLAALGLPVDINSASIDELASLPGIGPVLAARITAARPFASTSELQEVRGIGPKKMEKIRIRARTVN